MEQASSSTDCPGKQPVSSLHNLRYVQFIHHCNSGFFAIHACKTALQFIHHCKAALQLIVYSVGVYVDQASQKEGRGFKRHGAARVQLGFPCAYDCDAVHSRATSLKFYILL